MSSGTNKQKSSKPAPSSTGLYRSDAVKDVADSLGIPNLADTVASALASDVEYRIHQVIEEASRFMRHSRRTTLTTSDIDLALRVLNIEPLYGHSSAQTPAFRRAPPYSQMPNAGTVYFLEDEEIDFDRLLKEEKLTMPPGVRWTAHWLAVEGVQPLVPENPPAVPKEREEPRPAVNGAAANGPAPRQQQQPTQPLVKQVLSRELQLYYTRLTTSLLPPSDHARRTAALASLRHDAGLQALLPYLVKWVADGVVGVLKEGGNTELDGRTLEVLMDVVSALVGNSTLFVEPYLHQLLPPLLSTLLHSSLPPTHAPHLRATAAGTLAALLTAHSTTYPSLSPRITKTLLLALLSPQKARGTREGAVIGLAGIGAEAVRKGLVDAGGARAVGAACMPGEEGGLVERVVQALVVLRAEGAEGGPLDEGREEDRVLLGRLRESIGEFFADRVRADRGLVVGILGEG